MFKIYLHDVAILALEVGKAHANSEPLSLTIHEIDDDVGILAAHAAVAHRITPKRLQQRLHNGLRFSRFDVGGVPVATTWTAGSGGRYIDELNWLLPIGENEIWLRDVFVAPASRGKHLFAHIVAALARPAAQPERRIWSDVDWDNEASMRAHRSAGFDVVSRVRSLDLAGRIRLRSALPSWSLPIAEIEPESRWIWLRGQHLSRHLQLLA